MIQCLAFWGHPLPAQVRIVLLLEATRMHFTGEKSAAFKKDFCEGCVTTDFKPVTLGWIFGCQFSATVDFSGTADFEGGTTKINFVVHVRDLEPWSAASTSMN